MKIDWEVAIEVAMLNTKEGTRGKNGTNFLLRNRSRAGRTKHGCLKTRARAFGRLNEWVTSNANARIPLPSTNTAEAITWRRAGPLLSVMCRLLMLLCVVLLSTAAYSSVLHEQGIDDYEDAAQGREAGECQSVQSHLKRAKHYNRIDSQRNERLPSLAMGPSESQQAREPVPR